MIFLFLCAICRSKSEMHLRKKKEMHLRTKYMYDTMYLCIHIYTQIIYIICMYIKCKINVIAFLISTTP